jgi:hypothetical protein
MVASALLQERAVSPVIAVRVDESALQCAAVELASRSMSESVVATAPSQHWKASEVEAVVSCSSSPSVQIDAGRLEKDYANPVAWEEETASASIALYHLPVIVSAMCLTVQVELATADSVPGHR